MSFSAPVMRRARKRRNVPLRSPGTAFDLTLESTYTGKAMSALLSDWRDISSADLNVLYWHTFDSALIEVPDDKQIVSAVFPDEFARYFAD